MKEVLDTISAFAPQAKYLGLEKAGWGGILRNYRDEGHQANISVDSSVVEGRETTRFLEYSVVILGAMMVGNHDQPPPSPSKSNLTSNTRPAGTRRAPYCPDTPRRRAPGRIIHTGAPAAWPNRGIPALVTSGHGPRSRAEPSHSGCGRALGSRPPASRPRPTTADQGPACLATLEVAPTGAGEREGQPWRMNGCLGFWIPRNQCGRFLRRNVPSHSLTVTP